MTLICHEPSVSCPEGISGNPLRAGLALAPDVAESIRRSMMLDFCKWDPQVGDASTMAPFPLLMPELEWNRLSASAEALAEETFRAEEELLSRPELHAILAVPRILRAALRKMPRMSARDAGVRVMRFDFHWTSDGWRVSEVNSDVPGGFAEASSLPMMMARQLSSNLKPAGDPAGRLADALAVASDGKAVALLAAPGFIEDQQVTACLARRLAERGATPFLVGPRNLEWRDGRCTLQSASSIVRVGTIVRFYQAEWLSRLPRRFSMPFFSETETVFANPASALLTESKRFPLSWDALTVSLATWRRLLPESRDPRQAPWRRDDGWVLKTAYCNTGDSVVTRSWISPRQWRSIERIVRLFPGRWVAQRAFHALPLGTPWGEMYPCVGVFTVGGRAAGAYVRLSHGPVIDYRAVDVAMLIERRGRTGGQDDAT